MGHKSHEPWAHAIKKKQTVRGNKSIIIMYSEPLFNLESICPIVELW